MSGTRLFKIGKAPLTGEERTRQRNLKKCRVYLARCRRGRLGANAWNLWHYTQRIALEVSVSLEELGTNREEIRGYLIQVLTSLLSKVRRMKRHDENSLYDFIEMELLLKEGIITEEELNTTKDELINLGVKLDNLMKSKQTSEES